MRLGVDIGGTFTDVFLYNEKTGEVKVSKALSTPPFYIEGVMNALRKSEVNLSDISCVVHGSTIVDNAIIQRTLHKTCLITTKGFRDIFFIGRYWRKELFDIQWDKPTQFRPFIKRRDIFTIKERISSTGEVVTSLDEEEAQELATRIGKDRYESVAICFLNSYMNPIHEQKIKSIISKKYSNIPLSVSSDICPIIRELPRLSTTLLNACILPTVDKYIKKFLDALQNDGFKGELLIMQSNGGAMRWDIAISKPIYVSMSGPAAGVTAARYVSEMLKIPNMITFDMGGTTAKSATIMTGEPIVTSEYHLEWDVPIAVPTIDLTEVGAGGGSIAWIDLGGMLRVGPMSAGAKPGPVCYSMGGAEPTVTDANLVLGILNPDYFLGGEIKLDIKAAKGSLMGKIANSLGLDLEEAATGVIKLANTNMIQACRAVTIEKGYDPRDFTLIAFGGAGSLHSYALAEELGIPKIIIPLYPAIFSAFGLFVADIFHDFVQTYFVRADEVKLEILNDLFQKLEKKALDELRKEGILEENIEVYRYIKIKYVGEMVGWGLEIPLPLGEINKGTVQKIIADFHSLHETRYEFSRRKDAIHFMDLRVRGVGKTRKMEFKEWKMEKDNLNKAFKMQREVFFDKWLKVRVYERERLNSGHIVNGPAIIEEPTSTIVVPEGFRAEIDKFKNIILCREG